MSDYVNPVEQLIHSTVRIECQTDNGASSGSGYFFGYLATNGGNVPCIVTNKHVVAGAKKGKFHLTVKDSDGSPKLGEHIPIEFENFEGMWIGHPDPNVDLSVFPLGPLFHEAKKQNVNFYYIRLTKDIVATGAGTGVGPR